MVTRTYLQKLSNIGDRRWLLSRKRTDNVGDLVTQWRKAVIRQSLNWDTQPAQVMYAMAMQERMDRLNPDFSEIARPTSFEEGADALSGFAERLARPGRRAIALRLRG